MKIAPRDVWYSPVHDTLTKIETDITGSFIRVKPIKGYDESRYRGNGTYDGVWWAPQIIEETISKDPRFKGVLEINPNYRFVLEHGLSGLLKSGEPIKVYHHIGALPKTDVVLERSKNSDLDLGLSKLLKYLHDAGMEKSKHIERYGIGQSHEQLLIAKLISPKTSELVTSYGEDTSDLIEAILTKSKNWRAGCLDERINRMLFLGKTGHGLEFYPTSINRLLANEDFRFNKNGTGLQPDLRISGIKHDPEGPVLVNVPLEKAEDLVRVREAKIFGNPSSVHGRADALYIMWFEEIERELGVEEAQKVETLTDDGRISYAKELLKTHSEDSLPVTTNLVNFVETKSIMYLPIAAWTGELVTPTGKHSIHKILCKAEADSAIKQAFGPHVAYVDRDIITYKNYSNTLDLSSAPGIDIFSPAVFLFPNLYLKLLNLYGGSLKNIPDWFKGHSRFCEEINRYFSPFPNLKPSVESSRQQLSIIEYRIKEAVEKTETEQKQEVMVVQPDMKLLSDKEILEEIGIRIQQR